MGTPDADMRFEGGLDSWWFFLLNRKGEEGFAKESTNGRFRGKDQNTKETLVARVAYENDGVNNDRKKNRC
jgi:hypothetical protein